MSRDVIAPAVSLLSKLAFLIRQAFPIRNPSGCSSYEKGSRAREKIGGARGVSHCGSLTQNETVAAVPTSICSSMTFPIGIFTGLAIDMARLSRRHRRFDARRGSRQSAFELLSPVCSNNRANQREVQAASKIEC